MHTDPTTRLYETMNEVNRGDLSQEEFVIDMLATLRHYCDTYAVEFGNSDRIAHQHYLAEVTIPASHRFGATTNG